MPFNHRAILLLLSGTIATSNVACSQINALSPSNQPKQPVAVSVTPTPAVTPSATPQPAATPKKQPTIAPTEAYQQAMDIAYSAAVIAQSAASSEDWKLIANQWKDAIALLRTIPSSSSNYAIAQSKISQYQRNLGTAQQKAISFRPSTPDEATIATIPVTPVSPSPSKTDSPSTPGKTSETNNPNSQVFKVPIKRRAGRTPVINVTFNDQQNFDMILDTGASGTVITQAMANSLGVVPVGEVTANTANAKGIKFPLGKVNSIKVGSIVAQDVPVAIGGSDLELGLLGQDFYSAYDVFIRQDVVEFHRRS